jgi:glutaredoxin
MKDVILFTREGCCLCEKARDVLLTVQRLHPSAFRLREVDIETDERLHAAYLERIPVVAIDDEEVFELFVEQAELERRLGIVEVG